MFSRSRYFSTETFIDQVIELKAKDWMIVIELVFQGVIVLVVWDYAPQFVLDDG